MYKSQLITNNYEISDKPTSMYSMKNYCDDLKTTNNNVYTDQSMSTNAINNLITRQNLFLSRLSALESRVDAYIKEKGVLIQSKTQLPCVKRVDKRTSSAAFKDIVIQLDPNHIPLSIFAQFNKISSSYKCFITFLTHSSIVNGIGKSKECERLMQAFRAFDRAQNESRLNYDFGITIVWKRLADKCPRMQFDTISSTTVCGEANVLRFLERLMNEQVQMMPEDDDLMDKCTNLFLGDSKQNSKEDFLRHINNRLDKLNGSLGNELVDCYLWSVLSQNQVLLKGENKIQAWLNSLGQRESFKF